MKNIFKIIGVVSISILLGLTSCKKDTTSEPAQVNFRLTDGPGQYDNVYVDIQNIKIHSNTGGWQTPPNFNSGVYDLLELNNGLDTFLCSIDLPAGKISQIRLMLGDNNSVVVDGTTHSLNTPSGKESGVKLNLHEEFTAGVSYTVWLDFDAGKSVVETGNMSYNLKPVIRAFSGLTDGKLKGVVQPMSTDPVVYAVQGTDTLSAIPNSNGYFMMCGLGGAYDVHVVPNDTSYQTATFNGVQVNYGQINDLGSIQLQQ